MSLPEIRMTSLNNPIYGYVHDRTDGTLKFDLNAPYQRATVWTMEQRQALVMSLLMGLPVGSIICAKQPYSAHSRYSYRVVDGKQRIETVQGFARDEFWVPAEWWERSDLDHQTDPIVTGVRWSGLTNRGQRRFESQVLPMLEFDPYMEWHEDPEHPDAKRRKSRYYTTTRTPEDALAYEAMVYGLINGGGTPQTDEDMARAAAIESGAR